MNNIMDLPVLSNIWSTIFNNLSIQDHFTCRLVNKLFKHFSIHHNCINKLIIGEPDLGDDYYWYYNNKSIEDNDIISLKCFRKIQKLSIFNLDTNLKYLKIYNNEFKLKELLNLINLESIEFGHLGYNVDHQQMLRSNNLKVFVFNRCSFKLNTPNLKKIQILDIKRIRLKSNSESIKHLITSDYNNKLEIFKNLEIMELRNTNQPVLNENLLSLFKNLKQLKINLEFRNVNYSNERMKNSLIKILNDKVKLKRSIDIYLEGIRIENIDKFNELLVSNKNLTWPLRLNNYDLLDLNLPFIRYLNYNELEDYLNYIKHDLPSSFFDKFIHINNIIVSSLGHVNSLNWFLNKLKYLNELVIAYKVTNDVLLDEVFYNNLPNTIRYLDIKNSEDINCDFILKLSKLIEFHTQVDKDLFDLAFTSFLNLKYLNEFTFYYKKKKIKIVKNGNHFCLNKKSKALNHNQLIEECNKIRSK